MRLGVIICTRNRCELLRRTLESFRSLTVPNGHEWQLVVVDNGSSDATEAAIEAYRHVLPVRRVVEAEVGLSRARNTAVRAATGDLLLFTDDDVQVDPSWLSAYVDAARRWPDCGYFAGLIRPDFTADVPAWVRRDQRALSGMLCRRDGGPVGRRFRDGELPYGPNMAVRRYAFELASFDERVGRKGNEHVRGSETSLFKSLSRQGVIGAWVPEAVVHHYVPRCRADLAYLWAYYRGAGRMDVRLTLVCGLQSRWQLLKGVLKTLAETCRRPLTWPRHVATVAWMSGLFLELGRQLSSRRVVEADEARP